MDSSLIIKELTIGGETLRLLIKDQIPLVEFNNQLINHIWILCQQFTSLNNPAFLSEFAEVSNFLWKGLHFLFIEQICEYRNNYVRQVELEQKHSGDVFPYRLTDYKIFDVSVMHEPRLVDGQLHYFVCHAETGIPYRVVCPFPYLCQNPIVHYQILPIK